MPRIHTGGQLRPLYTLRIWDNESSGSDEDGSLEGVGLAVVLPKARPLSVVTAEVVRLVLRLAWFQGRASVEWRELIGLEDRRALAATQSTGIIHPWSQQLEPVGTSDTPLAPVRIPPPPPPPIRRVISAVPSETGSGQVSDSSGIQ